LAKEAAALAEKHYSSQAYNTAAQEIFKQIESALPPSNK